MDLRTFFISSSHLYNSNMSTFRPSQTSGHRVCSTKLTDWFLDDDLGCCLHEGSNANGILCGHSEEVGLSGGEAMSHGILSAGGEGQRCPGLTLCLALLNDVVTNGRATVILREVPVELAGVAAQVFGGEGDADRPWNI